MTVIVGGLPYRESVANISHSPLTALQLTHNFTTASPRWPLCSPENLSHFQMFDSNSQGWVSNKVCHLFFMFIKKYLMIKPRGTVNHRVKEMDDIISCCYYCLI